MPSRHMVIRKRYALRLPRSLRHPRPVKIMKVVMRRSGRDALPDPKASFISGSVVGEDNKNYISPRSI
jgi:hypothetical protein